LHNPLRSEGDAFRWAVVIGIWAASVVAVTLITRPLVGVIWAVAVLGFLFALAWRSSRGTLAGRTEVSPGQDGKHRMLVLCSQTVDARSCAEIKKRSQEGRSEILLVTPSLTGSRAAHWASAVDAATEEARLRMELSLRAFEEAGLRARGQVGDPDPNVALEDALRVFAADEIIIATLPPNLSPALEHGVVERARQETHLPVTHVVVDPEAEAQTRSA
jgi:GABA permease